MPTLPLPSRRASLRAAVVAAAVAVLVLPGIARAQQAATSGGSRWTIGVYGGALAGSQSSSGTPIAEFPVGGTFTTASGHLSRFHPSWRFGDGALLFNQVAARFSQIDGRPFATIAPLDDVLRSSGSRSGGRAAFGLRLARDLSPTLNVGLIVERNSGGLTADDQGMAAITAANASFEQAFRDLLGSAPVSPLFVESAVVRADASKSHTRLLGTLEKIVAQGKRWSFSVEAGGGLQFHGGKASEVRLNGRYQFSLFSVIPIIERDEVFIVFDEPSTAAVGLIGVAAAWEVSPVSSLRLGVRAHLAGNGATTSVRTVPDVSIGQPPGALPSLTTPGLQFSNQTSPPSSLSPSLASTLTTFTGSGLNRQILVTIGIVRRF